MSKIGRNGVISGVFFQKKRSGKNKMVRIGSGSVVLISFPGATLVTLSIMDCSECEVNFKTTIRIKVDVF